MVARWASALGAGGRRVFWWVGVSVGCGGGVHDVGSTACWMLEVVGGVGCVWEACHMACWLILWLANLLDGRLA